MQVARKRLEVDERREQLLELAVQVFADKTYDEISIDEIAKAAGISKGLLYHYFPSKRAFYVASLQRAAQQLYDETYPGDELPPGPERLREGLRLFLAYVDKRRVAYSSLLRGGVGCDPEVREIVNGTRERLVARVIQRFDAKPDPRTHALLMGWMGFLEGVTLDWIERQHLDRDELFDLIASVSVAIFGAASMTPRQ